MSLDFDLPSMRPAIRQWSDQNLSSWNDLSAEAEALSRRIDNPGLSAETSRRAHSVLVSEHPESHPDISDRKICRAIVSLWAGDPRLSEKTMRLPIFETVCENGTLTRLFTFALANVYYAHFDQLDDWDPGLFAKTAEYLQRGIAQQTITRGKDALTAVQQSPELALGIEAPDKLARLVLDSDLDLHSAMRDVGLADYTGGRYAQLARQRVYLDRIAQADPRQTYPWLSELSEPDIANASATGGLRFGHLVIEAMTRQPVDSPSSEWQGAILRIAGDPRARGTIDWNTWWSRVPAENLRRVIAWLSGEDVRLFLEAVKIFGEKNSNYDLLRMFPDRKHFLEGLLELKLVRETRLFAGPAARSAIRQIMADELRTNITQLSGANYRETAVIYMDCGRFYVVEGSHNFKMWVLKGNPPSIMKDWNIGQIYSTAFLNELRRDRDPYEDYVGSSRLVVKESVASLA